MTVNEFLTALEPDIKVSINETQTEGNTTKEVELIRLFSGEGATVQLSTEILDRTVDTIKLLAKTYLSLHLSTSTDNV